MTAAKWNRSTTQWWIAICIVALFTAIWSSFSTQVGQSELAMGSQLAERKSMGSPQLVSWEPMPQMEGEACPWVSASSQTRLVKYLQQMASTGSKAVADEQQVATKFVDLNPARVIRDNYANYSAVAVDTSNNEIVLQDENLFQILVYDRTANTAPTAAMTEPKRIISGPKTKVEFNCGLYIDQKTGDIYSVNNDTLNTLVIFPHDAKGNVPPTREISTPHGAFGIAVDEGKQLLYLTVEHDNAIVVYRKMAKADEPPVRLVQGDHTGLADPHGIALDTKNSWMFVANHGSGHRVSKESDATSPEEKTYEGTGRPNWPLDRDASVPGSGKLSPPSLSVYPIDARGDAAPLRTIQGPKTQMDWPTTLSVDEERGELYVANDGGDSVLVFRVTDNGNVAPSRVIKGPKTGLKSPTGVFVDTKNNEIVVSSMGNYSATVYSRTANGDVSPLRTIRSAPPGKLSLAIGNPGGVAYDTKRDELLVPN